MSKYPVKFNTEKLRIFFHISLELNNLSHNNPAISAYKRPLMAGLFLMAK